MQLNLQSMCAANSIILPVVQPDGVGDHGRAAVPVVSHSKQNLHQLMRPDFRSREARLVQLGWVQFCT